MKVVGKIEKIDELKAHFQHLSDNQVQVRLFTRGGKYLSRGRFIFEAESDAVLCLSPIPLNWSDQAVLSFHYICEERSCAFQARPISARSTRCLQVALPGSVLLFDRRKYFRVQPSKREPVTIRIRLPDKPEIRLNACDVSGGGFSVLVPRQMAFFSMDLTMPVAIELPHEERISGQVLIKGVHPFLDVMRIGCEFIQIGENARGVLTSYCMRRQVELKNAPPDVEEKNARKPHVCLIDTGCAAGAYGFLKPLFTFEVIDHLNAIGRLRQQPADLIVLNTDHAGAKLILQTLTRDRGLQSLPLILLGRTQNTTRRTGAVMPIHIPFKQPFLISAMKEMVGKVRLSNRIAGSYYRCFTGGGKKIVVLDPLKRLGALPFKTLEDLEFQLCWIQDEHDILAKIETACPDLLMLDSETGAVDPATLCRLINFNKAMRSIPKIRLLSGGEPPQSSLFDNTGIHFLGKPFDADQLIQSVNQALGRGL
jgi:CheY-like chemotaxis protein